MGNVSDTATNEYEKYWKEKMKEKLNFLRFFKESNYANKKELLLEFEPHLECLFSGKGGYDFPLKYDETSGKDMYDTSQASKEIIEYAKCYHFMISNEMIRKKRKEELEEIQEIIIMGHGLESDL